MKPHLPETYKNSRSFIDKFDKLLLLKGRYDKLQEKNKVLQKSVKEFVTLNQVELVSQELAERDICMIDSAFLANKSRSIGNTESNVIFVN
jgi:hypothetical protein